MKNKISFFKKIPISLFALLVTASFLNAQQVEVVENSSSVNPHVQLEETGASDFTRLRMINTDQDGYWNIAARSWTDDDFNIFYHDGINGVNLMNMDGDNRRTQFESDIKINNHLTEPLLIMDVEDKNTALIRFEANAGQESFIKYFAQQGGTAIPPYLATKAPGSSNNYMTMFGSSTSFSDSELGGSGGSARLRVLHDSEGANPQMRLIEKEETDYVRLHFTNLGSTNRANIAATPGGTGRMEIGFNGLNILSVHGADIISGGMTSGRVGINNLNPSYALELPNNALATVGQARAQDWDTYSDMRVKSNIKTIESAVETIKHLNPVSYRHHSSSFKNGDLNVNQDNYTENVGFLAQEVYEVLPTAVEKPADENEDLWAMSYDKIIPLLTKAIQEQQEVIETLQKEVAALKESKK